MPAEGTNGLTIVFTLYCTIKSLLNIDQTTFNSNIHLIFNIWLQISGLNFYFEIVMNS